jgi:Spy/CpxP family protein refolding chaperone
MLGWLFDRLRTTPEQERVIEEAFTRLRSEHASVREELGQTREDVARAVENGVVDESSLEETFARHDRLLARLRVDWVNALKTVSEALDPSQRREMAGLVGRRGFFGGRWGFGRAGVWA